MRACLKSFLALFILCLRFSNSIWAQCPEGIVHLSTDAEIIAFAKAYPQCTVLDSSLIVGPRKDMAKTRITDISSLSKIATVKGDFVLKNNPWLENIDAIKNIEIVDGDFEIRLSKNMKRGIVDLSILKIGGDLKLSLQAYKAECKLVFKDLIKIGGQITIYSHEIHHVMFPSLWKVGEGIWNYSGYAHFVEGEFPNLETVGGRIELNDFLDDGSEILPELRQVGSLDFHKTKYSVYMGKLKRCRVVSINGHDKDIKALHGIENLEAIYLRGANNKVIKSFKNLKYVETLDLQVYTDTLIIDVLPSLQKAARVVMHNEQFVPLVQAIDTISQVLSVRNFKSSKSINRLRVNYDSIRLNIVNGTFEDWDLKLRGNLSYLNIEGCSMVSSMQGLDLSQLTLDRLHIQRNEKLADISALTFLEGAVERISLVDNPALKVCQTDWICKLLKKDSYSLESKRNHEKCSKSALILECKD